MTTTTVKATTTTVKATTTTVKATTTTEKPVDPIAGTVTREPLITTAKADPGSVLDASITAPAPTAAAAKLPSTGAPTEQLLIVAAGSTLVGGLLLASRRRKPAYVADDRRHG